MTATILVWAVHDGEYLGLGGTRRRLSWFGRYMTGSILVWVVHDGEYLGLGGT